MAKEDDMSATGIMQCPQNDGTCSIPGTAEGLLLVARKGLLTAVSQAEVDGLIAGRTLPDLAWRQVEVRLAALATTGGGDEGWAQSVVHPVGDRSRAISGVYVKCQPCGHTWIDES